MKYVKILKPKKHVNQIGRVSKPEKSVQTTLGWYLSHDENLIHFIRKVIINSDNFAIQQQEQF